MRDTRRTRLVLSLLLLASLTLITIDFRSGSDSPIASLRGLGATVFGPIERAAAAVVEPVHNTVQGFIDARGTQQQIASLRRENARLHSQLRAGHFGRERVAELEGLLNLAGRGRYRIVPAEVVAVRGALGFEYTTTIDVGAQDGIKTNMTVISAQGLVGRVIHVGANTSTVLLAVDGSSHVGARLASSDEIGVVQGDGLDSMRLTLLDSDTPVKKGARLVTFGSQGGTPYVPGVPVGTVRSVQRDPASLTVTADVDPYVDFSKLDLVGVVVKPPSDDPRDSLLPPKPTAGPTAGKVAPNGQRDGQGSDGGTGDSDGGTGGSG